MPRTAPSRAPEPPQAWAALAAAFLSMFTVFGVAYSFGAFLGPMGEDFGTGTSATSAVFSITAFLYFSLGALSGPAVDRFGPRPVLVTGAVAMGAGLAATAVVHRVWLAYLTYGAGVGVGVACGYVPMVAVVGGWFDRRRSTAVGVAVSGIGVGTLVGAPAAAALIGALGWRATTAVLAGVSTAVLLGCAALVRRPPVMTGGEPPSLSRTARLPAFRWLYLSMFAGSVALFVPFVYLVSYARDQGSGRVAAAALISVIGAASTAGRLGLGALADRFGHLRTYRACVATMAVSFLLWLPAGGAYPVLVVFAVVLGLGYGGFIALAPAVAAMLFGVRGLGGTIGVLYTGAGLGALVGAPAAGAVIDARGYPAAVGVTFAVAAVSFLLLLPLRHPHAGHQGGHE